jgi:cell division septal protein FtsQ
MTSFLRRRPRVVLGVAVAAALLVPGGLWLRGSALVEVREVAVTGVDGRQAPAIRAALTAAARDMTTLHVRTGELMRAVEAYPIVHSVRTDATLLHRLHITVTAYEPVAAVESGARATAVAADGTLLRGAPTEGLPRVRGTATTGSDRLTDAATLRVVGLLAAAPPALRQRVQRVFRGSRGLSTTVRGGPKLYFGTEAGFRAKWAAAAKVLGDERAQGAGYVDVRLPDRPAVGGLAPLRQDSTSTIG